MLQEEGVYNEAIKEIRSILTNMEKVVVTLKTFLLSETRPIPLSASAPERIDRYVEGVEKAVKEYYADTKGLFMPKPEIELKRIKTIIHQINFLITRIN